ncbi:uncharacterized protein KY384_004713 [Bacidia gigantensis]|uniref:uncharacterized protein n=1 Tax=Bacidia gigantensis TaxID=2732470 RepID=UPI001D04AA3C|nr:uncharacterized protein KY384_004713 [Bacidia gigantensis]KAG8530213.1 hypothetical protein KY384_004713 [Bacidia gigantensis]
MDASDSPCASVFSVSLNHLALRPFSSQNLESLVLDRIDSKDVGAEGFAGRFGPIASLVRNNRSSLVTLGLSARWSIPMASVMIDSVQQNLFPKLKNLCLGFQHFATKTAVLHFFKDHAERLEYVFFCNVYIRDGSLWKSVIKEMRNLDFSRLQKFTLRNWDRKMFVELSPFIKGQTNEDENPLTENPYFDQD